MTLTLPFLAACRENPQDAFPWLVFADWLEEQGHLDRAERMRFMAGQVGNLFFDRYEPLRVSFTSIQRTADKPDYYFLQVEDGGKWHISEARRMTEASGPRRRLVTQGTDPLMKLESLIPIAILHHCGIGENGEIVDT